jgi:hypothetical protein
MRAHRVGLACTLAALAAAPAAAQLPLTPRALGMGNAYVAVARGQEVLFQNPANLALPGNPHWSFAVPQIGVGLAVSGIEVGDLNDLIEYGDLEQAERDALLDEIPDQGTELRGDLRIPLLAAQIRRVAFGVSYGIIGRHSVDRDLVDLLLNGVEPDPTRYDLAGIRDNTQGYRATYYDFAAGYAHRVGPVSLGVTGHYYLGSDIVRSGVTRVDVDLGGPDVDVRYSGVRRDGGSGFGVDLGAAFQPMPSLTLSAAVGNVVNTFEWDDQLRLRRLDLDESDYESGDLDALNGEYVRSEVDYESAAPTAAEAALAEDLDTDAGLPTTLRAGVAWEPIAGTQVGASYHGNLEESRISGLWDRSLGVGVQHRLVFLPIVSVRAGLASNLDEGSQLSAGLSLGPVHVSISRVNDGGFGGADRTGWIAMFGLGAGSQSTMQ